MRLFGGLFNFDKEGKGVPKNAPKKPEFIRFWAVLFRHFFDVCKVSVLAVLFSIPIITVGPATAAATYVLRNIAREEHTFIWMDFYDTFKNNFKQTILTGIFDLIALALSILNIVFYVSALAQPDAPKYFYFMMGAAVVIFVCYFIARMYLYPILVTFDISVKNAYKNSFIFTIIKFPQNLLKFILASLPAVAAVLLPLLLDVYILSFTIIPYVLFLHGFGIYISVFSVWSNIQKIMIDRFKKDDVKKGDE